MRSLLGEDLLSSSSTGFGFIFVRETASSRYTFLMATTWSSRAASAITLTMSLIAFQNCSPGFSAKELASLQGSNGVSDAGGNAGGSGDTDTSGGSTGGGGTGGTGGTGGSGGGTGGGGTGGGSTGLTEAQIAAATTVTSADLQCLAESQVSFTVPASLKYFGAVSLMGSGTRNFDLWKSYTLKTMKMGNTQYVDVNLYSDDATTASELKKRLDFLFSYRQNIALSLNGVFFENDILRPNYAQKWSVIAGVLAGYDKSKFVAAYIFDEPFWNAYLRGIPAATMKQALITSGQAVKATLPSTALMLVEAYPMVNSNYEVLDIFDWVGMDCYDQTCFGKTFREYYSVLSPKLKSHQKLVLITPMVAMVSSSSFTNANSVAIKDLFLTYAELIRLDSRIIGAFGFVHAVQNESGTDLAPDFTTGNRSCHTMDAYRLFWKKMKETIASPPTTTATSCTVASLSGQNSMFVDDYLTLLVQSKNASQVQVNCGNTWNSFSQINCANIYAPGEFVATTYTCQFRALTSAGVAVPCSPSTTTLQVKPKVVCTAGSMNFPSASGGAACSMSWPQGRGGETYVGNATGGGSIRAKCGLDTLWTDIVYTCP